MSIEASINARLTSDSTLYNLVAERIWPTNPPADPALPFVLYRITSLEDASPHLQGQSGLTRATVEIDLVSKFEDETVSMFLAVQALLNAVSFTGIQYSSVVGTDSVQTGDEYYHQTISYRVFA